MNVLSLFDGMSCGRIALDKLNTPINNYYACEIDKYAIQISKKNYPDIIQLGDVVKLREMLEVFPDTLGKIDLLIGGSPCQGFSFAGKQLNFDDPRSSLFFEFVKIKNILKPKYFLLENVKMKKEYKNVISDVLGVEPIEINSNLVSAQNRKRLYWCNWGVKQPEDREIYLKDILENGVVDRDKSYCIDANYYKVGNMEQYFDKCRRQLVFSSEGLCHCGNADIKGHESVKRVYHPEGEAPCLTTMGGGHREPKVLVLKDKSNCVRSSGRGSKDRHEWDSVYKNSHYRKLTPLECERLQTLPDNYTEGVSNTQRYKMLGNGWTVDVIAHIFSFLPLDKS
jgi:DNA-cytosine methyltransferase